MLSEFDFDSKFRQTCRILFGDEIGPLTNFIPYLTEYMQKPNIFKSYISNNDVYVSGQHYMSSAKFLAFDELDWKRKFPPLSINEIKDIDSIANALYERFIYTGNIVLGTCKNIERSSNIIDSFFVSDSNMVSKSEYVLRSSFIRNSKYMFGTHDSGNASFAIRARCIGGPKSAMRLFESFLITGSSDIFYSSNLDGCQKCWFSFFQRGKKYLIGNFELTPIEYSKIESQLREQLRSELSNKKRAPGLFDLLKMKKSSMVLSTKPLINDGCDPKRAKEEVEKAWRSTSSILVGKELSDIDKYGKWLSSNVDFYDISMERSPISNEDVYVIKKYWMLENISKVFIGMEKEQLALVSLPRNEISSNLSEMIENASCIAYISCYYSEKCTNLDAPIVSANAINAYKNILAVLTKNAGFSFWPRESTNIFGGTCAFSSSFCINTHYVQNVNRTFEVNIANNSSDIYFCHNVEGVYDGMYCFNVKSIRNAIGNVEYSRDDFVKFKKTLLEQISNELERTKTLRFNIYNLVTGQKNERSRSYY